MYINIWKFTTPFSSDWIIFEITLPKKLWSCHVIMFQNSSYAFVLCYKFFHDLTFDFFFRIFSGSLGFIVKMTWLQMYHVCWDVRIKSIVNFLCNFLRRKCEKWLHFPRVSLLRLIPSIFQDFLGRWADKWTFCHFSHFKPIIFFSHTIKKSSNANKLRYFNDYLKKIKLKP